MGKIKTTSVREKEREEEQMFLMPKLITRDEEEDENEYDEEGEEAEEASQAKLLSDMMKITKKKGEVEHAVRTSLSTPALDTTHLLDSLRPSSALRKERHTRTLPLAPEKTVARKIKRAAGYESVAMEVNKWAKVVKVRREADQLNFPLERTDLRLKTVEKTEPIQLKQPLEREVYALLQGAKLVQEQKDTEEEAAVKKALSLQELRERNRELWRQKEMKRRYEQKARLMNKSKSRKHHRLLRRERLRKQRAELEELQKTDAEAALEKMRELDQARIEERMSLRHKTSKWAHLQGFRATRDKAAMASLQENQRMHRELTTKTALPMDADDDDGDDDSEPDAGEGESEGIVANSSNPWMKNLLGSTHGQGSNPKEEESFTRFKKFWEEVNSRKEANRQIEKEMEQRQERERNEKEKEEEEEVKGKGRDEDEEEKEVEDNGEEEKERDYVDEECKSSREKLQDKEEELNKSEHSIKREKVTKKRKSEPSDKASAETTPKKKKRNAKKGGQASDEPISIDDLLDEAEAKIKNKVKKKLKKMGMKTEEPWREVKTKKKVRKEASDTVAINAVDAEIQEFDFTSMRTQENTDERQHRIRTLEEIEALKDDSVDQLQVATHTLKKASDNSTTSNTTTKTNTQPKEPKLFVDPNKFLQVEARWLSTSAPDSVGEAGEALDDDNTEESSEDVIREAFADDYLMEEFRSEKAEAIKKDQPGTMSLALPGWGDWTGPNLKMSNTKIKRFRLRVPHAPRKDSNLGNVLYNEQADVHSNLRKSMVSELPYPFKSVKDFEASVRAPIGRLFVPEAAHKKLTAPATITKLGAVIQPMTEEELLQDKGEKWQGKPGSRSSTQKGNSDAATKKGYRGKALKTKLRKQS